MLKGIAWMFLKVLQILLLLPMIVTIIRICHVAVSLKKKATKED